MKSLRTLRHALFAAGLIAGATVQAASLPAPFAAQLNAAYAGLESFYQDLHAHPELGFNEHETAAKLAAVSCSLKPSSGWACRS